MPPQGQSCGTCVFFVVQAMASPSGECHRYAPYALPSLPFVSGRQHLSWPLVDPEDWCGEWAKSAQAAQAVNVELIAGTPVEQQPPPSRTDPH